MSAFRYGVFRLGQVWSVLGDDGLSLGFPSRHRALSEALALICGHRACGEMAELVIQDEVGRLFTATEFEDGLDINRLPAGPIWDPFPARAALRLVI